MIRVRRSQDAHRHLALITRSRPQYLLLDALDHCQIFGPVQNLGIGFPDNLTCAVFSRGVVDPVVAKIQALIEHGDRSVPQADAEPLGGQPQLFLNPLAFRHIQKRTHGPARFPRFIEQGHGIPQDVDRFPVRKAHLEFLVPEFAARRRRLLHGQLLRAERPAVFVINNVLPLGCRGRHRNVRAVRDREHFVRIVARRHVLTFGILGEEGERRNRVHQCRKVIGLRLGFGARAS